MIIRSYDAGIVTGTKTEWAQEAFTNPEEALAAALEWAALRAGNGMTPTACVIAHTITDEYDNVISEDQNHIRINLVVVEGTAL